MNYAKSNFCIFLLDSLRVLGSPYKALSNMRLASLPLRQPLSIRNFFQQLGLRVERVGEAILIHLGAEKHFFA